ncbi:mechanosensitive ion channel [Saccharopolyspora erythraea]|uniref:mechanosensitive ion channel n=1 Tax=Saccharopolyspora erythraea TaxID=1836 RepID=UPI001BA8C0B6|nr:mechanosensitive ion channel [Saccharopolyspora erythraea]QUH00636.1 mechanosensitive ion channel [Saccharopolyspora erythraea]
MFLAQGDIGRSLLGGLEAVIAYIPTIIGALVILLIGYIVAKVVQKLVEKGLHKLGVDRRLKDTPMGGYMDRATPGASPSRVVGKVAFWLIFLIGLVSALGALGIAAITNFMNQVLAYVPNIIAAIAIFIVAGLVAGAVSGLARRTMGETATGRVVTTAGPTLVMGIAVFMILTQLGIAPAIVQITYTAMMGAIALGLALAFGLGGRDIAADMLRSGYDRAQREQAQTRQEATVGRGAAEDTGWSTTSPSGTTAPSGTTSPGQTTGAPQTGGQMPNRPPTT